MKKLPENFKPYMKKTSIMVLIISLILIIYRLITKASFETIIESLLTFPIGIVIAFIIYYLQIILYIIALFLLIPVAIIDLIFGNKRSLKHNNAHETTKQFKTYLNDNNIKTSLTHIIGRLFNLIRMTVYSNDREKLSIYKGTNIDNSFNDIINIEYRGKVNFNKYKIENNYLYVNMDILVNNTYNIENKIFEKQEIINATLCKNINIIDSSNNIINLIKCHSCGGSFDATNTKICPYCRNEVKLEDYDWVISDIKKTKKQILK